MPIQRPSSKLPGKQQQQQDLKRKLRSNSTTAKATHTTRRAPHLRETQCELTRFKRHSREGHYISMATTTTTTTNSKSKSKQMHEHSKHKRRRRREKEASRWSQCLSAAMIVANPKQQNGADKCCPRFKLSHQHQHHPHTSVLLLLAVVLFGCGAMALTASAHNSNNNLIVVEQQQQTTGNSTRYAAASAMATGGNQQQQHQLLQSQQQIQVSFATPNQAVNITHVTYDPLHDTVYLGATNAIYQLNGSDLSETHEQTTGPVFDNPSCGITECHGYEDYMKPTQNVNKILVIDYQHHKLLSCGSVKQGACRRYQLNNIAQKEDLISMAVAANDDNSSTYAFIAPARYTYDPSSSPPAAAAAAAVNVSASQQQAQQQQQVLYVATTYTKVGQSRDLLVPAIGTRTLEDGPSLLKLYENSFLDSARIDINSHLRDYFLVNYLYGFASSNYIYFVTVQKKATSRDYEELGYHTRLARICITDSSYNSYTEVDLKCVPQKRRPSASSASKHAGGFYGTSASQRQQQQEAQQPAEYQLLQDAILVDAGSQLLQSLAQNDQLSGGSTGADFYFNAPSSGSGSPDDNKVLLGVFSSARDHTQHAGEHSALCAFSLSQIEDKFNDNIHNCYTGKMQSRNMEYIAGNVQECPKSGQGGNVVNFCHETLKINGTLPIVSEASIQFHNTTLTAITATSHVNSNTKNIYSDLLASELSFNLASFNSSSSSSIPSSSFFQQAAASAAANPHTVVFLGTSNGHLKKVLLNNASNGIEFEDVQLDTNPILSDLHLHSSGQQLIVATPYKVMKVPTHNCAQYSTCRECSQSKNPYCGWCSLKRSCTTKNECVSSGSTAAAAGEQQQQQPSPLLAGFAGAGRASGNSPSAMESAASKQLKWISNDSAGKCIDLQSIVPDKIPITSTGKVDLYIDRLPRLPKEHSYKCIFDRREQTTATPMSFGLSCPLPKVMHRPKIQPGRDHAIVDLAVRSSETNTDFLNGKITFFECQLHTTCKDCLTTSWGCNWCLNENICLFNTSKCEKTGQNRQDNSLVQLVAGGRQQSPQLALFGGPTTSATPPITISSSRSSLSLTTVSTGGGGNAFSSSSGGLTTGQRTGNTINLVNQCPTFDVGHKQDILIADGSEKELTIKVKNMPQFKGNIQCIVEIENDKIPLKARIEEDRVICENSTYSYAADVGLLNGQLVVIYSDNNIFIDRTNFTMYKCHLLGAYLNRPDCSLCQRIDPRFNCAWCAGACHHKTRCTERPDDTCPPPRIDYIHPLNGPTLGGTKVTIEGSNLGQSFEEIANRVTIGNVPCKPIEDEYRPSNKIVCISGPIVSRYSSGRRQQQQQQLDLFEGGADVILGDVMVGNKAGYSIGQSKFQFKSIYLRDHQPRYGPQSGGTRITLTGMNLNIGSNVQVFLDELACQVEPSLLTAEQIVCLTSASRHPSRAIRQLKLIIDDAQIVRDEDVFYYTQDPIITKVTPLRSYLSGGRPINVYGANLTAVQMPKMAILDATGKKINESLCILQDDTRMQCPSPAISLPMMDLEWSEQHIGQYEPQAFSSQQQQSSTWTPIMSAATQTQPASTSQIRFAQAGGQGAGLQQPDESVKFRLSFIMDNVWRLRDLQTSYPSLQTEIAYTSDPKLYPFASGQYKLAQEMAASLSSSLSSSNGGEQTNPTPQQQAYQQSYQIDSDTYLLQPGEPILVLYGEHLRAAVSEYEITVTVGQDMCNLTQLTQSKLVCLMPLDHMATPTDEEGHQTPRALPLVVVRIGFNLRYELGYIQYHPLLVEQIVQTSANSSEQLPYMRPTYPQYMPRENESLLHKIANYITATLLFLVYLALGSLLLALVYSGMFLGYRLKRRSFAEREYRRLQSKIDSLERSVRGECRLGSLALQTDLNELVRHVDLSGIPLLNVKHYIMKVFFPGIHNHPLLVKSGGLTDQGAPLLPPAPLNGGVAGNSFHMQQFCNGAPASTTTIQRPMKTGTEFPMEYFERLILTKPFLITFINTMEAQPSFTIRDKVNVASLVMVILMERLDYATDILRTLLFQLVERSVHRSNQAIDSSSSIESIESRELNGAKPLTSGSRLSRRASNLLGGLPAPIGKRGGGSRAAASLSKVVGGSASSLMASTTVAAQMLLSRVGHKTSPLQPAQNGYLAHNSNLVNGGSATMQNHCMSTTTFNQNGTMVHTIGGRPTAQSRAGARSLAAHRAASSGGGSSQCQLGSGQAHLMLRRTDSVVEKMLTNWLALNMYDYFNGEVGNSLYMMFEALKCQLERGPIDAISGDAYYSLNEHKLLREPNMQFDVVNLYIIVDTSILQPHTTNNSNQNHSTSIASNNLLLDSSSSALLPPSTYNTTNNQSQSIYEEAGGMMTVNRSAAASANYATSNTITLSLRVLDCDTISQVKGKILSALYRNSPYSNRLGVDQVELSLRQQQSLGLGQAGSGGGQYVTVTLLDEDYSSVTAFNGLRRLNSLRHYGVTDQAIMMLNRCHHHQPTGDSRRCQAPTRTTLTDMLDEHYNNPYSEIQYGPIGRFEQHSNSTANSAPVHPQLNTVTGGAAQTGAGAGHKQMWHLVRSGDERSRQISVVASGGHESGAHSNDSSPSSNSPSMMLLGAENLIGQNLAGHQHINPAANNNNNNPNITTINRSAQGQQQQYHYHPSSSSTSSTGNVMDTNSTSANSSSMNVTNLLKMRNESQPIYCQIGSQHGGATSSYYCQIGGAATGNHTTNNFLDNYCPASQTLEAGQIQSGTHHHHHHHHQGLIDREQENNVYLTRMLTSKGTVQSYVDDFFKTILNARPTNGQQIHDENQLNSGVLCGDPNGNSRRGTNPSSTGACPPAVKWLFDLLDEAAMENGITDHNVIHAWKSNAFLLRFWVNIIKNPNYILDIEKSNTLDATLSVVAQTLMDSCSVNEQKLNKVSVKQQSTHCPGGIDSTDKYLLLKLIDKTNTFISHYNSPIETPLHTINTQESSPNKLLFAKDTPKYKGLVKRFYQDIASMRTVSDQEIVKQMGSLSMTNTGRFDTNLALKELCVYAVNYGVELMGALSNDFTCQQLELSQQLEQCFRSFTIFEAYR